MDDFQWNWGAGPVKDDEFRWNWAKANVDPSYKIQGPGIGSLLRAIHPDTQADAIQQMNNNLAADRANIETIAKQGALENDIVNKLYDEQADSIAKQNSSQHALNSVLTNYVAALKDGNAEAIPILEDQIRKLTPDADKYLAEGKQAAEAGKAQTREYASFVNSVPTFLETENQKNIYKAKLDELRDKQQITMADYERGVKFLDGKIPKDVRLAEAKIQAQASAGGKHSVVIPDTRKLQNYEAQVRKEHGNDWTEDQIKAEALARFRQTEKRDPEK